MPRLSSLQDVIQSHAVRAVSPLMPPTTQIPHLYSTFRRAMSRPPIVGQVQEEFRLPGNRKFVSLNPGVELYLQLFRI
jgi:hypothetical protein